MTSQPSAQKSETKPPDEPEPPQRRHALSSLWRLRHYLRPYRGRMIAMFTLALAATGAALVVPWLIQRVIDGPITGGDTSGVWLLGGAIAVFGFAEAVIIWIRRFIQAKVALGLEADMRADLYAHMQKLHAGFHDRWQTGQLLARATADLGSMRRFMAWGLIFGAMSLVTFAAVTVQLVALNWQLGLLVAASAVPLFFTARNFARAYIVASRQMQDQQGEVASIAEQAAQGIRVIKAFGRAPHMERLFGVEAVRLRDVSVARMDIAARSWATFNVIPNATLAIVLVGGAIAVAHQQLTIGGLVAFVSLQLMLVWPVEALGWIIANGNEAMTAADRVKDVFDTEPAIADAPGAVAVARAETRGHVRFEGVSFAYEGVAEPVLDGVDLEVRPGETLAIAGVTGSGKTTLVSLVPRLYDVTGGRVTIDGTDIRDLSLASLRSVVATAFEDPTLFSMSVRENLTLGRAESTDAEVAEALRVAQAEFVHDLPYGLDTRIGEQGLSLSGGQRQRLALARAVLVKPAVLVLDDPLSALDVHTEELVERALASVLKGTTALIVVHRPSTVMLADRVALLAEGRIAAIGSHSELLETVPAYAQVLSAESEEMAA
ncbi:ABC transporter ATP-binding protein [Stackebrandtia nassauensis]|uniref:ABC transporter related protein n=1 Tax=Stackebrandtia nassauensis (strain DSM 44728 / CIP 108903 / NRRL B-16338 / NBRC 102104 / LLR-40K-21) TaxID=446470 RepID=D3PW37_STANL|nr:ABC transporter ATP-binding protein [Stackebrandtia nassauensis]ADD45158.1 ABC transporter related protein [Stackebrandtia nassauensis DSM 44728]